PRRSSRRRLTGGHDGNGTVRRARLSVAWPCASVAYLAAPVKRRLLPIVASPHIRQDTWAASRAGFRRDQLVGRGPLSRSHREAAARRCSGRARLSTGWRRPLSGVRGPTSRRRSYRPDGWRRRRILRAGARTLARTPLLLSNQSLDRNS